MGVHCCHVELVSHPLPPNPTLLHPAVHPMPTCPPPQAGPHRVEVVIIMYAFIVDRKQFWTVLYALRPLEQGMVVWRLGPLNVFDRAHPSLHYILNLSLPAHEKVAHMLVDMANNNNNNGSEVPNFWNIRLQGGWGARDWPWGGGQLAAYAYYV